MQECIIIKKKKNYKDYKITLKKNSVIFDRLDLFKKNIFYVIRCNE